MAPDLLGHGGSSRPGYAARYAPERVIAHLGQLLDAPGASPAFVVGQSMGGALALDLARVAPERVRGLVLLGSIGFTPIRRIQVARALRGDGWERHRVPRWVVR